MKPEALYSLQELEATTGVSIRNIRYYTTEGLLPPPTTRGKYALYSQEHIERLLTIQKLKEAYLPLAAIRAHLEEEDQEILEELSQQTMSEIAMPQAMAPPPMPASMPAPASIMRRSIEPPSGAPAPKQTNSDSAADYIKRVLGRSAKPTVPTPTLPPPPPPITTASVTWERTELAPGIELHVRAPQDSHQRNKIAQLIAFAQSLFGSKRR